MKLQEYRSKEVLARHGVPLLPGKTATTPEEARGAAEEIGGPVVVKAQVLVGGRGKAGGVKLAATPEEAEQRAREILGLDIKGIMVRTVLVAPAAEIATEYYLGLILDRAARAITVIASAEGGVEIEETAKTNPEAILRLPLHPLIGLQEHQVRRIGFFLGIPAELRTAFATVMRGLFGAFVESDADLAEINPLVVTDDGRLLALDAKIVLDDSALARHPDLEAMRDLNEEEPSEIAAREAGISFIKLDGTIGCMVNGAGLAMTTMDLVKLAGGEPANFLDIGGGAKADKVTAAFRIILDDPNVKAILINIFGGITRGDEVARGIVEARANIQREVPMVVRIVGTNAEEARPILAEANLITAD
ncbi:MAG: ADP-forming succinate--CoA ligase subunit beta, partial [Chloroflexota bacterium]|nr:ADP-forming succinate--CoA ligase subunit beta [Chloroflexota bacterium]